MEMTTLVKRLPGTNRILRITNVPNAVDLGVIGLYILVQGFFWALFSLFAFKLKRRLDAISVKTWQARTMIDVVYFTAVTAAMFTTLQQVPFEKMVYPTVMRTIGGTYAMSVCMKQIEILSSAVPKEFTASNWNFLCHMMFFVEPKVKDGKMLPVLPGTRRRLIRELLLTAAVYAASIFVYVVVLGVPELPLFSCRFLLSYVVGVMMFSQLSLGLTTSGAMMAFILGLEPRRVMHHPLTSSRGFRDFWTRWNVVAHTLLKRGVFKPFMHSAWMAASPRTMKATVGSFLVFFVSGAAHAYGSAFIHLNRGTIMPAVYMMVFFLGEWVFCLLEMAAERKLPSRLQKMMQKIPTIVPLALLHILSTPLMPFFLATYNLGYKELAQSIPRIVLV